MDMTPKRASQIATILLHADSRSRSDVDVFDQFVALDGGIPSLEEWRFVGKSIGFQDSPTFINLSNALSLYERLGETPRPRFTAAYIKNKVTVARTAAAALQEKVGEGSPSPSTRGMP